jgi:SPP1 gp7 family putative phage head morphogenesis protein
MADYWAERTAKTQAKLTSKNIRQTEQQLKKYIYKSMENSIGQFLQTYNKYLSSIEEGREPTVADLYKLDSYWKMQNQLKAELQKLGDKELHLLSDRFVTQYLDIYNSIALKGEAAYSTASIETAQQMINHIWCADGKSWSQRIWKNNEKLQQALNDKLIECVITGKTTRDLKNQLQEQFKVSYGRADALVRTEMAHIQTQAAKQRYEDYGIKEVEILADEDERRCEICGKLHGQRFPIGANVPIPAHTKCRCCIVPVVE